MTLFLNKKIPKKCDRPHYDAQAGASLLALSLFITILGMLMSGGLYILNIKNVTRSDITTSEKLTIIENALMAYFDENGRFPCVASMTAPPDHFLFGRELPTGCFVPYARQTWMHSGRLGTSERIHVGTLPTRTLGLDDSYMIDGWGRRIVYALDIDAVSATYWQVSATQPGSIYILGDYTKSSHVTAAPSSNSGSGGTAYSGVEAEIAQMYRDYLGREPDEEGLDYWVNDYENGVNLDIIAYGIKHSVEGQITTLYRDILNRNPDPDGMEYWKGRYNDGMSIYAIRLSFQNSAEAQTSTFPATELNLSPPYQTVGSYQPIVEEESITTPAGGVIFTLIAPGQDSRGAYNMEGNLIQSCDMNVTAGENCDYNSSYYGDNIFVSLPNKTPGTDGEAFTAQLRYKTKFRLSPAE